MGTLLSYMKFVPLVPKCHVAFQYQRYHKYWFFLYFSIFVPLGTLAQVAQSGLSFITTIHKNPKTYE